MSFAYWRHDGRPRPVLPFVLLAFMSMPGSCRQAPSDAARAAAAQDAGQSPAQAKIADVPVPTNPAPGAAVSGPGNAESPRTVASSADSKTPAAAGRGRAARSIDRAMIARLDPRGPRDVAEPPTSERWAGLRVLPGTEHPLDEGARDAFAAWLRGNAGFNDKVVRRCARAHVVGFLLFAKMPDGSERRTDVVVDFVCNQLLIVSDEGGRRAATAAYFDASRAELLAIVRRALPLDKELARLK